LFLLAVAGVIATFWFGFHPLMSKTTVVPTVSVQSSGAQSPNVVDNQGKVEIQNQQSTTSGPEPVPQQNKSATVPKKLISKPATESKQ
jgi:hypothetical protein